MESVEIIRNAVAIRSRLRFPPNAVADRPINLSRPRGIYGSEAARIAEMRRQARLEAESAEARRLARERAVAISFPPAPVKPKPEAELPMTGPVRLQDIAHEVCRQWDISLVDIVSARRTHDVVVPRHIGMILSKKLTLRGLKQISDFYGGRDHTTVLWALKKYDWLVQDLKREISCELSLCALVAECKRRIDEQNGNKTKEMENV